MHPTPDHPTPGWARLTALVLLLASMPLASGLRQTPAPQRVPPRPMTPQGPLEDPLDLLAVMVIELASHKDVASYGRLPALLDAVTMLEDGLAGADTERARDILLRLLDLAGSNLEGEALVVGSEPSLAPRANRYRRLGLDAVKRAATGQRAEWIERWLLQDVLMFAERHPEARRLAALAALRELRPERGELVLLSLARRPDDPLRPAALSELAAWPGSSTDLFLVRQLGRPRLASTDPHPVTLLMKRIQPIELGQAPPLDAAASRELAERIGMMMLSTDWRQSARGLSLSRGLIADIRVPLLIESLRAWNRRSAQGRGSRRVENDVLAELRAFSKRGYGPDPERWELWWRRVRYGEVPFEQGPREERSNRTKSGFFGLRPISDKLTFVIDRSGSMESEWGTTNHSRYDEAIEQMVQYLQAAGPETWFNVILFNSEAKVSSIGLRRATAEHLELARRALLAEPIMGGTRLRPAIQIAMRVEDGRINLDSLEADTVIVLCDGQTEEGPDWVAPLLEQHNVEAQIKFHCVLLGTGRDDDGTLRQLAERTGGDFLRIGG